MGRYSIYLVEAIVLIFNWFSAFDAEFLIPHLPTSERKPVAAADASNAITAGIATIVDNKPIPPTPLAMVIVMRTVSTLSTILAALKYFLANVSLVITSFSRND